MNKLYTKTNWINNTEPDINASNLNKIENGIDGLDNRILQLDSDFFVQNIVLPESSRQDISAGQRLAVDVPFSTPTGYRVASLTAYSGTQAIDTSIAYYSGAGVRVMATNKATTTVKCPMTVFVLFTRKSYSS